MSEMDGLKSEHSSVVSAISSFIFHLNGPLIFSAVTCAFVVFVAFFIAWAMRSLLMCLLAHSFAYYGDRKGRVWLRKSDERDRISQQRS